MAPNKDADVDLEEMEEAKDEIQETDRSWDSVKVCIHGSEYP
ncbi:MAG: hypothetical protein PUJ06_04160 [Stecheria intestinalis]|nr:hypothetical protein [Stecheria intestinalis]